MADMHPLAGEWYRRISEGNVHANNEELTCVKCGQGERVPISNLAVHPRLSDFCLQHKHEELNAAGV